MSFSRGLQTGWSIADDAFRTIEDNRRRREFNSIASAKPQETSGYQPQDIESIQAMTNARDPSGNPYYSMGMDASGRYTAKPNFDYEGGSQEAVAIDPQKRYSYLGRVYDQQPNEQEMMQQQTKAYAKALSRTDPRQGMAMQRDQLQFDMAREQHDWKKADAQHTQNERAKAEKLRTGWQERFTELTGILQTQGPKGLVDAVGGWFSQDGSGFPTMLTYDDKDGRIYMTSNVGGRGRVKELSVEQALAMAQGMYEMGNGDPKEGLKTILTIQQQRQQQGMQEAQMNNQAVGMVAQNDGRLRDDARARDQLNYSMMDGDRRFGQQQAYQAASLDQGERRMAMEERRATQAAEAAEENRILNARRDQREEERHNLAVNPDVDRGWYEIEKRLGNMDQEQVRARQDQYYASQGYAPPSVRALMARPTNPRTGKPWTPEDIDSHNRRFPKTPLPMPKAQPKQSPKKAPKTEGSW